MKKRFYKGVNILFKKLRQTCGLNLFCVFSLIRELIFFLTNDAKLLDFVCVVYSTLLIAIHVVSAYRHPIISEYVGFNFNSILTLNHCGSILLDGVNWATDCLGCKVHRETLNPLITRGKVMGEKLFLEKLKGKDEKPLLKQEYREIAEEKEKALARQLEEGKVRSAPSTEEMIEKKRLKELRRQAYLLKCSANERELEEKDKTSGKSYAKPLSDVIIEIGAKQTGIAQPKPPMKRKSFAKQTPTKNEEINAEQTKIALGTPNMKRKSYKKQTPTEIKLIKLESTDISEGTPKMKRKSLAKQSLSENKGIKAEKTETAERTPKIKTKSIGKQSPAVSKEKLTRNSGVSEKTPIMKRKSFAKQSSLKKSAKVNIEF